MSPPCEQKAYILSENNYESIVNSHAESSVLAFGCGSSYGDVCLNSTGALLDTRKQDRFLNFDEKSGVLRCQAGVTLREINRIFIKKGWFLPVTPGTQNVTIGGAIANDVHGKNHHKAGSFGCHILSLGLWRSEEGIVECDLTNNQELFKATIAGLGLTGLILWSEIKLRPVTSLYLNTDNHIFTSLEEFNELSIDADDKYEYTVAWIDSVGKKRQSGRGVFFAGNHAKKCNDGKYKPKKSLKVPFNAPSSLLNYSTIKLFNTAYYYAHKFRQRYGNTGYESFFYPLDNLSHWNRLYGRKGFYQYQCVTPVQEGLGLVQELLNICAYYNQGSFLSVLKKFGDIRSPGMLTFPRPGYTLALDFRNLGKKTHQLFNELDTLVFEHGGALYPAKDARMSAESFRRSFSQIEQFSHYIDSSFASDFARRVMLRSNFE